MHASGGARRACGSRGACAREPRENLFAQVGVTGRDAASPAQLGGEMMAQNDPSQGWHVVGGGAIRFLGSGPGPALPDPGPRRAL